jgi:hypothetical protein
MVLVLLVSFKTCGASSLLAIVETSASYMIRFLFPSTTCRLRRGRYHIQLL